MSIIDISKITNLKLQQLAKGLDVNNDNKLARNELNSVFQKIGETASNKTDSQGISINGQMFSAEEINSLKQLFEQMDSVKEQADEIKNKETKKEDTNTFGL